MDVILREDVETLGRMGDRVNVADGYARNYLIPQKKAVEATSKSVKAVEHEKRLIAAKAGKIRKEFEALAEKVRALRITIPVQVGEGGKLFGSVTNKDIAEALANEGVDVDKRMIQMETPLREVGEFTIPIRLHHDVTAHLSVTLIGA